MMTHSRYRLRQRVKYIALPELMCKCGRCEWGFRGAIVSYRDAGVLRYQTTWVCQECGQMILTRDEVKTCDT